jgi:crotonobetainyl-CoA:carnitine CoA-transferase CaiB-like acyl-CoA transferase
MRASRNARVQNRELVTTMLAPVLKRETTEWWVARLEALKIGCGSINTLKDVFNDPQIKARAPFLKWRIPRVRPSRRSRTRSAETPADYRLPPPLLGEHTVAVLRDRLGLSEAELETLRNKKAI